MSRNHRLNPLWKKSKDNRHTSKCCGVMSPHRKEHQTHFLFIFLILLRVYCASWRAPSLPGARSIQVKFSEISVQNLMDRFGPTAEKFRKNGSTFWGGPRFPVGPVPSYFWPGEGPENEVRKSMATINFCWMRLIIIVLEPEGRFNGW